MTVWSKRWLHCPLCEEFTLLRAKIATDTGRVETPTNDCRDNACARDNARKG
ncbi:hypothetical protein Q2941_08530 [Bradyrhizobium sp. UFLA05-153]